MYCWLSSSDVGTAEAHIRSQDSSSQPMQLWVNKAKKSVQGTLVRSNMFLGNAQKKTFFFTCSPRLYIVCAHCACTAVKVQCAQCTGGLDLGAGGRKDKRMKALQEVTKRANKSINLPIHALSLLQLRLIVCQNWQKSLSFSWPCILDCHLLLLQQALAFK